MHWANGVPGVRVLDLAGLLVLLAAELQQGHTIIVGPGQAVNDDLYAYGSNVQVLGTVKGETCSPRTTPSRSAARRTPDPSPTITR